MSRYSETRRTGKASTPAREESSSPPAECEPVRSSPEGETIRESKDRAWWVIEQANRDLDAGVIDEEGWHRSIGAVITPAYLAGDNPRAQSGHSGDDERWTYARGLIADAVDRDGAFLDIGCASGYLMETLERWCRERGFAIEPDGLDIAPELARLARKRLPHWAGRIHVGNALHWDPPRRYDFVRTGLEYVPPRRERDLVDRLLRVVVSPGGRLILGTYAEEREEYREEPTVEEKVASWGYRVTGRSARVKPHDPRLFYTVIWIDSTE